MRLEMVSFPVRRDELGARTAYGDGLLTIDAGAVRTLVLRDPRIADVQLELLHPGESTRVLRVLDAVEPLVKLARKVGANRVVRGVRSGHPCGNPALSEADERMLRIAIVREALAALRTPVSGPTLFESAVSA